ncbi:defective in cullin neddylation protein 1 [Penicillium chermesinum]|uniref:Defective in cullin neddylation protein n=1 Tax=Penicillium chermesinum TaxID=63820 RepID=A0A9W9P7N4_9EURO|nr:defective in cullin neddylation protein 1 [Penicillium chermesinum]KAJ5239205.1 defective in cullin neddylation protein 1 [Penicillium chermesinum]
MPPSASAQRYAINQVVGITGVTDIQATKVYTRPGLGPGFHGCIFAWEQRAIKKTATPRAKAGRKAHSTPYLISIAVRPSYVQGNRATELTAADPANDEDDKFGIEGSMAYFADLEVKIDEITCLGIAEICKCPAMGEFTREGFVNGWMELEYVHPRETSYIAKQKSAAKSLRRAIPTEPDTFRRVYRYCFLLSRMQGQRNVLFDIAVEQWRLFFSAQSGGIEANTATTPWLDWWIEFLDERGRSRLTRICGSSSRCFCARRIRMRRSAGMTRRARGRGSLTILLLG